MDIKWVPFDFTALATAQQVQMFVAWCRLVMSCLKNYNAGGLLQFEAKGDTGPAAQKVIQGAQAWITYKGKELKYNRLIAFTDMLENDRPRQGSDVRRNDPNWFAGDLVESAKDKEIFPPPEDTYGFVPRPEKADIEV
jgi:hypothetical protein